MRRKISLYIGDLLADLDDQSLVLLTYTAEDTQNPATVLNSYSRQVTLPGTARNAAIFGSYYRLDRRIDRQSVSPVGTGFTPTQKVPFAIYDELDRIVVSGYLRLDKVTRTGRVVESYSVTLFGGLGSFFYELSYAPSGDKLTLADLPYLTGAENELDFNIRAVTVMVAWARLGSTAVTDLWDILNFAPCYNGIPENFAADKALVIPSGVGLPITQTKDGNTYARMGGTSYALVNLPQAVDEWAAKDMRAYLQRPVLSVRGLFTGLANYAATRGWTLVWSGIPHADAWITLPMINTITMKYADSTVLTMTSGGVSVPDVGTITASPAIPGGTDVTADLGIQFTWMDFGVPVPSFVGQRDIVTGIRPFSVVFFQVVAMDAYNQPCGGSRVHAIAPSLILGWTPEQLATACSFQPDWTAPGFDTYAPAVSSDVLTGGSGYNDTDTFPVQVSASNADHFEVMVYAYDMLEGEEGNIAKVLSPGNGTTSTPTLYESDGTARAENSTTAALDSYHVYISEGWSRTGALVTKRALLSSDRTPADYLIAFAKIHGLSFVVDDALKTVTVVKRNDYYRNETVDITSRVDFTRQMEVTPLAISSKWFSFVFQGDAAAFWSKYLSDYGATYGLQRVNTGYDFDAGTVDLLNGIALRGAASILDNGPFWNVITEGGDFKPSPFVLHGVTYTLYNSSGDSAEFQVPSPTTAATVTYFNATNNGYDVPPSGRLEFRDKDGKPLDGSGVLVMYEGNQSMGMFHLSDDLPDMGFLNNRIPCWIFDDSMTMLNVPTFSRLHVVSGAVDDSLEFGVPFELGVPGIVYQESASLYAKAWKAYIGDRYDADTKVVRCWVDFSGIQVGPELLRKFYFFDGALWVLNKIVNYSLTTWDPVECEFIQVQDPAAYTSGQNF